MTIGKTVFVFILNSLAQNSIHRFSIAVVFSGEDTETELTEANLTDGFLNRRPQDL